MTVTHRIIGSRTLLVLLVLSLCTELCESLLHGIGKVYIGHCPLLLLARTHLAVPQAELIPLTRPFKVLILGRWLHSGRQRKDEDLLESIEAHNDWPAPVTGCFRSNSVTLIQAWTIDPPVPMVPNSNGL